jgi:hypothetical protein
MDEIRLSVQLALGLVFLLSALGKALNPAGFARGVKEFQILPGSLAYIAGLLLIPLEMFLAVSHLTGWLLGLGVLIGLATIASFVVAVSINLKRGRALPCYCFSGQGGETLSGRTVARLLLLFAGELLLIADPGLFSASELIYPGRVGDLSELGFSLFWAIFTLIAGMWLLSLPDVIELLNPGYTFGRRRAKTEPGPAGHSKRD